MPIGVSKVVPQYFASTVFQRRSRFERCQSVMVVAIAL